MARALDAVAPGTAHRTWRSIVVDWITAGCPLPTPVPERVSPPVPKPQAQPVIPEGAPATAITATLREDGRTQPRIPMLGLFRNETWTDEFEGVPVYGNGALH